MLRASAASRMLQASLSVMLELRVLVAVGVGVDWELG